MNKNECSNCGANLSTETKFCKYCSGVNPYYDEDNDDFLSIDFSSEDDTKQTKKINKPSNRVERKIKKLSLLSIILSSLTVLIVFIFYIAAVAGSVGFYSILFNRNVTSTTSSVVGALLAVAVSFMALANFIVKIVLTVSVSNYQEYRTELTLMLVGFIIIICSFIGACKLFHKTKNVGKDNKESPQEYLP